MRDYIASPFFTDVQRDMVRKVARRLRSLGNDVYVPMEHEIPAAWEKPNAQWAKEVFEEDRKAIDNSDAVIVINWGMNVDTGTAWECGYACGIGKKVLQIIPKENEIYSLMMINCTPGIYLPDEFITGKLLFELEELLARIEQK